MHFLLSTRGLIIAPLLWWLGCIAVLASPIVLSYTELSNSHSYPNWQFSPKLQSYLNQSPASKARLQTSLNQLSDKYIQGKIANEEQLIQQVTSLALIREAFIHKNFLGKTRVVLSLFIPFARMNDVFLLDKKGKLARIDKKTIYNIGLSIHLPYPQYKQHFPSILFLVKIAEKEGIALARIKITPSGTWTVDLSNGWKMVFGYQPDFTVHFRQLRTALSKILGRGEPVRFDFRYDNAIAVTYR